MSFERIVIRLLLMLVWRAYTETNLYDWEKETVREAKNFVADVPGELPVNR